MNEAFVEIPLDPRQYAQTDEFSFVLKPSGGKGIGVFTTHGIRKGTHLQLFPNGATRKFTHEQLEADPRLKKFCQFYGVDTARGSSTAPNFGCMSVGWYLNHSETPNATHDEDWEYFATRDIAANEEITIDYRAL
jgi:SET domain-containing protein